MDKSTEILLEDLRKHKAPQWIIDRALDNKYHDFKSDIAFPEMELIKDATKAGLNVVALNVRQGRYDATKEESEEWTKSPEGQEVFQELINGQANSPKPEREDSGT